MASSKKVLVPIANGTEPMEAVILIDVLRRAGTTVTVASVESSNKVDAAHGVKIVADHLISDCRDTVFDLIALPGGMPGATNLKNCATLEEMVKKQAEARRLYAAVCASPAVALGSWGVLKGLKATCYPSFMEQLKSNAEVVESRVQRDGVVTTSRAPGTTMEFAVALAEQLCGKEKADEVSGSLLMQSKTHVEKKKTEINSQKWTCGGVPKVLVPVANGTEEMEAVIIIDVMRRAKAHVTVASVEGTLQIEASRGVKLEADALLVDCPEGSYDIIILPGGLAGAQAFAKSELLVDMIRKQLNENRPYAAICASPAIVLEPHGFLKGKKATAFPSLCGKLSDQSEISNRVLIDGYLITSRGPGTAMEFSLSIVEKFFGRDKADEISKALLFSY